MRRVSELEGTSASNNPLILTGEGMAWLGVAALLAAMGWYKSINLVLLLAYLMFTLILLNGFLARAHARRYHRCAPGDLALCPRGQWQGRRRRHAYAPGRRRA